MKKAEEGDSIWLAAQRIVDAELRPLFAEADARRKDDPVDHDLVADWAAIEATHRTDREVAARLAALEALDPSQKRPTPKRNRLGRVDYIEF